MKTMKTKKFLEVTEFKKTDLKTDEVEYTRYQKIIEATMFCNFFIISKKIIQEEIVPQWAVIQNSCFGSTDWKSSLPKYAFKLTRLKYGAICESREPLLFT